MQVARGGPFTRPVREDFAQEIPDARLAPVNPEEMAQLLALLGDSTAP